MTSSYSTLEKWLSYDARCYWHSLPASAQAAFLRDLGRGIPPFYEIVDRIEKLAAEHKEKRGGQ